MRQNNGNPLPQSLRRRRCSGQQRLEDLEHVVRVDVRYGPLGEAREGELLEAADSLSRVFRVLPLGPLQLEDLTGDCLERHR